METYFIIKKQDLKEKLSPNELKQFHYFLLLLNNLVEYREVSTNNPKHKETLARCCFK